MLIVKVILICSDTVSQSKSLRERERQTISQGLELNGSDSEDNTRKVLYIMGAPDGTNLIQIFCYTAVPPLPYDNARSQPRTEAR